MKIATPILVSGASLAVATPMLYQVYTNQICDAFSRIRRQSSCSDPHVLSCNQISDAFFCIRRQSGCSDPYVLSFNQISYAYLVNGAPATAERAVRSGTHHAAGIRRTPASTRSSYPAGAAKQHWSPSNRSCVETWIDFFAILKSFPQLVNYNPLC